jgi:hypothetical protein
MNLVRVPKCFWFCWIFSESKISKNRTGCKKGQFYSLLSPIPSNPGMRGRISSISCTNELLYRVISMMDEPKEKEIASLRDAERRRGRRPRHPEAEKLRKQRLDALREILTLKNEEDFIAAIRSLGHGDDPAELADALKIWRAFSSSRKT